MIGKMQTGEIISNKRYQSLGGKSRISFSVDSLLATTEQNYRKNALVPKNAIEKDDGIDTQLAGRQSRLSETLEGNSERNCDDPGTVDESRESVDLSGSCVKNYEGNRTISEVGSDVDVEDDASSFSEDLEHDQDRKRTELMAPQPLRASMPRFLGDSPMSWPFPSFAWLPNQLFSNGSTASK